MKSKEIKIKLLQLICDRIDEESLFGIDSFVEMNEDIIHVAINDENRYFKLILVECKN